MQVEEVTSNFSPRLIRVRRKRLAEPLTALLLTGALDQQNDGTAAAGPSKKPRQEEGEPETVAQPEAYRFIGTLPKPDVRDAARLFLSNENPKVVHLVDVEDMGAPQNTRVVPVQMDNLNDLLMENMAKVNSMEISADPFLAVADEAPLARPESGLDGELDDYVYDFYHAGTSASKQSYEHVNVRLPTDEELQMYFAPTDTDDEANDDDLDSNAENYYANSYPDEDEFANDAALENESTSDDSYDHYGDENERDEMHSYLSDASAE